MAAGVVAARQRGLDLRDRRRARVIDDQRAVVQIERAAGSEIEQSGSNELVTAGGKRCGGGRGQVQFRQMLRREERQGRADEQGCVAVSGCWHRRRVRVPAMSG
jgi:hypothetical protein